VDVLSTRLSGLEKTVEETKDKLDAVQEDIRETCDEFQKYVEILEEISSEREKEVWFIQVASFKDTARCDKLEETLRQLLKDKQDLTFFRVKSTDDQDNEWFGLRIGYFDTQMSAWRCQERLVSKLQYLQPVVFPGSKQIW